jgi:peptidoglycan/xylan/chitin deacetylase (PgdA/CDA1 family)
MLVIVTVIIFFVVAMLLFYASYSISSGVYLNSLCRKKSSNNYIAITFDDGVDPNITPKVLDILKKYNAKATFFIIGEHADSYPQIVKRIVDEGHDIGNHSYYHKGYFPMQKSADIYKEIQQCSNALKQASGKEIELFRPPFGVTNPMIGVAVRRSGLQSIGWSIRSLDTIGQHIDKVERRVIKQIKAGEVILLHDNRKDADLLLDRLLHHIQNKGLEAVTIKKLFNL